MKPEPTFEEMLKRVFEQQENPGGRFKALSDTICDGTEREMFSEVRRVLESGTRDEIAIVLGALILRGLYHQRPAKYGQLRELLAQAIDDRM